MNLPCAGIQNALINHEPLTFDEDLVQHLGQCSACAARLTAQQGISRALKKAITHDDAAPPALRIRIRHQFYRPKTRWQRVASWFDSFNQSRLVMAVAASMLIFMLGAGLIYKQMSSHSAEITHFDHSATVSEHNAQILKIGWSNHMHCAVKRDYSSGPRSFAQMAQALGDEWIELVEAVKSHVPTDYQVMIAHHCKLQGREFIHLVLSNQQTLLSLTLTPKNGEAFDPQSAITQIAGATIHQMREQNYSIAGFETPEFLGYVVSGLEAKQNLQLAVRLVPAMREFVTRRES